MAIPIQNIYYLLCYAWQLWDENEEPVVTATVSGDKVLPLLTAMLLKNTHRLLRQGLAQQYLRTTTTLNTLKGRVNLTHSYKADLLRQGKAQCTFDELSPDILPNQIIKAILEKLLATPDLPAKLIVSVRQHYRQLDQVTAAKLSDSLFAQILAPVRNKYYRRALLLCQLLYQNLLPEPGGDTFTFNNILADERQMGRLFELFVRNFLQQEQNTFQVKSERIFWQTEVDSVAAAAYLPQMVTDISLYAANRQLIIDTKFYKQALVQHYNKQKIISGHLYQLFAYLKNHPFTLAGKAVEGILLYPVTTQELDLNYQLHGHRVSIKTLNLAQPWPNIKQALLNLIA